MRGNEKYDIYGRIYKFVLRVFKLTKLLPRTTENLVLIKQVCRSASSIGANSQEASAAISKREFIRIWTIAKREAVETKYWLSLIGDTVDIKNITSKTSELLEENKQLIAIISTIILKSKKNS